MLRQLLYRLCRRLLGLGEEDGLVGRADGGGELRDAGELFSGASEYLPAFGERAEVPAGQPRGFAFPADREPVGLAHELPKRLLRQTVPVDEFSPVVARLL